MKQQDKSAFVQIPQKLFCFLDNLNWLGEILPTMTSIPIIGSQYLNKKP